MYKNIQCMDCLHYDNNNAFDGSNLRMCSADGQRHWKGDSAEKCGNFMFRSDKDGEKEILR